MLFRMDARALKRLTLPELSSFPEQSRVSVLELAKPGEFYWQGEN
jgi:hypothetical protein